MRLALLAGITTVVAASGLVVDGNGAEAATMEVAAERAFDPAGVAGALTVIVRAAPGDGPAAAAVIRGGGGVVLAEYASIDTVSARVSSTLAAELVSRYGLAVSADAPIQSLGQEGPDASADDGLSMSMVTQIVGAQSMWEAGYTGRGVDVAVIDTGVTRVAGLAGAGKVVDGPDLSFDSQNPALEFLDAFGHGTQMAGIVAGSDVGPGAPARRCSTCTAQSLYSDTTKFVGIAPEARIINVKVGAADGSADVSQILAAIDWVISHRQTDGLNMKVLSLSFGTDSLQTAVLDPLSYAAEVAWRNGIVVVSAAGNDGAKQGGNLASPAYNPRILAVGAVDTRLTLATKDDVVADFSQRGDGGRGVDLVAPGAHMLGLRVPGSFIDMTVSTGKVGSRYQRGSGTSQATAVTSGLVALILQKFPAATPDQVKSILASSARSLKDNAVRKAGDIAADAIYAGDGETDLGGVALLEQLPVVQQPASFATGLGTLEASRGAGHVVSNGVALVGEQDIFGRPWQASVWAAGEGAGSNWSGDIWNGSRWTGSRWTSNDWAGFVWTSGRWEGMTWDGSRWTGSRWTGSRWTGSSWTDSRWTTNGSTDQGWTGSRWSVGDWS